MTRTRMFQEYLVSLVKFSLFYIKGKIIQVLDFDNWHPLQPPINFILLIVPMRYLCCGSNCFVFGSRILLLFEPYVRFHIFSSVRVT